MLPAAPHSHEALFAWDDRNVTDSYPYPRSIPQTGQEITFSTTATPQTPLAYAGGRRKGPSDLRLWAKHPMSWNHSNFGWVPSMETLTDGKGFIDPEYYSGHKPELVASRLRIKDGLVSTYSFGDINQTVHAIKFGPVGGDPLFAMRQPTADIVVVEISYKEDLPITFTGKSLDGTTGNWSVELTPYNDGNNYRIDVLLGNLSGGEPEHSSLTTLHFGLYNSLLALRSSYQNQLFPVVGGPMTASGDPDICDLAPVVLAVSGVVCEEKGGIRVLKKAGPARPICMLASFEAPQ